MGHLPIVTQKTVEDAINEGYSSTRGNLKKQRVKTTADIFSDVLATRKGDLIFPWIVAGHGGANIGFKYVFKVAGNPIFVKGSDYPVKIPLERTALEYDTPLTEPKALTLWNRKLLWNAIGKKSLGRGRSLTHQTPWEDDKLMALLEEMNEKNPKEIKLKKTALNGVPLHIDPSQDSWNPNLKKLLDSLSENERLSNLDLSGVPWRSGNRFRVEKALEAWVTENLDGELGKALRELSLWSGKKIEWFGNYLPFGVQGSNMDVVVVQDDKDRKMVTVIELKVGPLSRTGFKEAVKQVRGYCEFIERALKAFDISSIVKGSVISAVSNPRDGALNLQKERFDVNWVGYSIDPDGTVHFKEQI